MRTLLLLYLLTLRVNGDVFINTVASAASTTNWLTIPSNTALDIITNKMSMSFVNSIEIAGGTGNAQWWIIKGRTAFQWAILMDGTTPAATSVWKLYYEGPGRAANRFNSTQGAPPGNNDRTLSVNTLTLAFSDNTSAFWMRSGAISGTPPVWNEGGTMLDIAVAQAIDIGLTRAAQLCQGSFGEYALWNTNLSYQLMLTVNLSHIKRMPLQIKPGNLKVYLPLDEGPDTVTVSGTNYFHDLSGNHNHATPIGGISCRIERVCSYPPNE